MCGILMGWINLNHMDLLSMDALMGMSENVIHNWYYNYTFYDCVAFLDVFCG